MVVQTFKLDLLKSIKISLTAFASYVTYCINPFCKYNYIFALAVAKERVATQPCKVNAFFIFLSLQNIF